MIRLTILMFILGINSLLAASGYSQSTKITLKMSDARIEDVLNQIESKSEFYFLMNQKLIDINRIVSINAKNEPIAEILDELFAGTDVGHQVIDKQIILTAKSKIENQQQVKKVTGKVTDATGIPLPGVSIVVKGTTTGVISDNNGIFSLSLPDDTRTLVFSFIGMKTQEIVIAGKTSINVTMTEETVGLEEVVAIGYGEKKRANMTGSVASVDFKTLESRPITNTIDAIQGVLPGLTVQRSSGQPGSEGFDLNVRGLSSTNGGNSPLVLIDGVAGSLDLLNPADIESISVLKDASSSIYGARAANGVFLVTTRKGLKGATKISYSSNFAVTKLAGMMDTPNSYQFALMDNEANIHNGAAPMFTPDLLEKTRIGDPNPIPHPVYGSSGWMLFFTSTDWRKAVFENGFQQKHTVNVSGGG
ncbi:MAG TPA: TonB-dependent receptor plug domain-containing protein, partial [Prolixibacteraceae bacterium]